jgi:uncharacterized repeat protein (TIGR01451 family)
MHHEPGRRRARRHLPLARPLLALACLALPCLAAVAAARPSAAGPDAHTFGDPIFSANARGDVVTIGNVTTTCEPGYHNDRWTTSASAAACRDALGGAPVVHRFDGEAMPPVNNRLPMAFVDVDDDPATFSSSMARLHLPAGATVLWAGLHWNAATHTPVNEPQAGSADQRPPVDEARRFEVLLARPGRAGYQRLSAAPADGRTRDTWDSDASTTTYGGFVDVTDAVRAGGAGEYRVADVQSCQGFGGCFGSWSLTVAYAQADEPARNLNVWHGWQLTSPSVDGGVQAFTVRGITPPPAGDVSARIGVVQADGDRGLGPDALEISSPSSGGWHPFTTVDRPLNPGEGDWFNSTVNSYGRRRPDADASPNPLANLNQDLAQVEDRSTIGNDDRSVSFRVHTAGTESLYSQVVHSAVDLYEPTIALTKSVAPQGPLAHGSIATFRLEVRNTGIDPVRAAVVTDPLPPGLAFVPGSIRYLEGGPADVLGPKSDRPGDDQADYDAATRTLRLRVGAGADATTGGTLGIAPATDGSHRLVISFAARVDAPAGASVTNVAHAHGEGRQLDDAFGPTTTDAEARAEVAVAPVADLGIAKSDGGAVVRAVGDRITYTLEATNGGPSPATGVTVTDQLDPLVRFVDSDDGCRAEAAVVTCPVGDLAVGATATRSFVAEVVRLPGPGQTIPNVGRITGDQPNPDCDEPTPEARCNQAGIETPEADADLSIDKTDDGAVVHAVGDVIPYRLVVRNAGPDGATGVRVDDRLDRHLAFAGSDDCSASGPRITCAIGDLGPGEEAEVRLRARVTSLPDPGRAIPNTATVRADAPDPDCGPTTPEAGCNHDTERTPRPVDGPARHLAAGPSRPTPPGGVGSLVRTGVGLVWPAALGLGLCAAGATVLRERARRRADPFRPPRHARR